MFPHDERFEFVKLELPNVWLSLESGGKWLGGKFYRAPGKSPSSKLGVLDKSGTAPGTKPLDDGGGKYSAKEKKEVLKREEEMKAKEMGLEVKPGSGKGTEKETVHYYDASGKVRKKTVSSDVANKMREQMRTDDLGTPEKPRITSLSIKKAESSIKREKEQPAREAKAAKAAAVKAKAEAKLAGEKSKQELSKVQSALKNSQGRIVQTGSKVRGPNSAGFSSGRVEISVKDPRTGKTNSDVLLGQIKGDYLAGTDPLRPRAVTHIPSGMRLFNVNTATSGRKAIDELISSGINLSNPTTKDLDVVRALSQKYK